MPWDSATDRTVLAAELPDMIVMAQRSAQLP